MVFTEPDDSYREIKIKDSLFRVYPTGNIVRRLKSGTWKEIANKVNHKQGYNVVMIQKKQHMRGRIIAHAFLGLDLEDKTLLIHHINGNRSDCSLQNIQVNDRSTACLFHTSKRGWHFCETKQKYIAIFTYKGDTRRLGGFNTPEEAHQRYMQEKLTFQRNICS